MELKEPATVDMSLNRPERIDGLNWVVKVVTLDGPKGSGLDWP